VELSIALVLLIAIVVTLDVSRHLEPKRLPPAEDNVITSKITVDLDRRS
jgi:hypothetical protein